GIQIIEHSADVVVQALDAAQIVLDVILVTPLAESVSLKVRGDITLQVGSCSCSPRPASSLPPRSAPFPHSGRRGYPARGSRDPKTGPYTSARAPTAGAEPCGGTWRKTASSDRVV